MGTAGGGRAGAADSALREHWAALRDAMELGDVTALDGLLAEECTLTHLTGAVQTKRQWLDDVDAGRIRYDRVEDVELAVAAAGPAPVVTARTMTEALLHGLERTWPLQLRIACRAQGGAWVATEVVATTW